MDIQNVGRYEITAELGRGAMGVVYKALDPTIGRTVALKTMRLDVHGLETDEVIRRFKNEARAAGVLNHPNIVTIYDAGEDDGMFYIAMEFIQGTSLQQLLAENRALSPEETIQISRQVCKGLDYAHANGIIHRDIKPANIMISPDGTVKIMDFGIAKAGSGMTSTGKVLGTPNYMSPEQVRGKNLDGRSDLFSFGVVLYEMVTGEKPFAGENITTVIYKIVHEDPIPPRNLDVTIHPGLSTVVTKALAKSADDRYQTGAALIHDLENYKTAGSSLTPTAVLPTTAINVRPGDATIPLSQPVRAAAAANIAPTASAVRPSISSRTPVPKVAKRGMHSLVLVSVLLVMAAVGSYLFYLYKATKKIQSDDQVLEQKINQQQQEEAAKLKTAGNNPQDPGQPASGAASASALALSSSTAESQGELRFDSQPRGAKVSVDGGTETGWVTPFTVSNLSAGEHKVVFFKPGYVEKSRTITVAAGKNAPVAVELSPALSKVVVSSTPAGAYIVVDGKETGKVTPAELTLEKGEHTLLVHETGYYDSSARQTVTEGQRLSFWLIPEGKGLVHVHTIPEGATIWRKNRKAPYLTNVEWPLDPGTYDIELKKDGYKPVPRSFHVETNREVTIEVTLEKQR
jgi:serine/threonine-protein kinase